MQWEHELISPELLGDNLADKPESIENTSFMDSPSKIALVIKYPLVKLRLQSDNGISQEPSPKPDTRDITNVRIDNAYVRSLMGMEWCNGSMN